MATIFTTENIENISLINFRNSDLSDFHDILRKGMKKFSADNIQIAYLECGNEGDVDYVHNNPGLYLGTAKNQWFTGHYWLVRNYQGDPAIYRTDRLGYGTDARMINTGGFFSINIAPNEIAKLDRMLNILDEYAPRKEVEEVAEEVKEEKIEMKNFKVHDKLITYRSCGDSVQAASRNGQREMYLAALVDGLNNMEYKQFADLYLGNPHDTNYVNKTRQALYLGTLKSEWTHLNFWLTKDHDGSMMVVTTTDGDTGRSTCSFHVCPQDHWVTLNTDPQTIAVARMALMA